MRARGSSGVVGVAGADAGAATTGPAVGGGGGSASAAAVSRGDGSAPALSEGASGSALPDATLAASGDTGAGGTASWAAAGRVMAIVTRVANASVRRLRIRLGDIMGGVRLS